MILFLRSTLTRCLSVSLDETKTSSSSASEFSIFSIYLFTSFSQNQLQKESTRNVLLSNCQTFIFTVGHIQQASPQPAESTQSSVTWFAEMLNYLTKNVDLTCFVLQYIILTLLCHWDNFRWPNIEQTLWLKGHTAVNTMIQVSINSAILDQCISIWLPQVGRLQRNIVSKPSKNWFPLKPIKKRKTTGPIPHQIATLLELYSRRR